MLKESGNEDTLKAVVKKFEQWRAQRKTRRPIPPELLKAVHPLTKSHTLSRLCEALRINYNTLKKSMAGNPTSSGHEGSGQINGRSPSFVEIPMKSVIREWPALEEREVIELETPRGEKVRFFTSRDFTEQIEGLLQRFIVAGR
jgi:hypothetical protein